MKITKPTLLINLEKVTKNITTMKKKADENNLIFRPHFKTHQSVEIGAVFKDLGVKHCTVSSVEMAELFAKNGWDDITIAFPFNKLEIKHIKELSEKIHLNLLVIHPESVKFLNQHIHNEIGIYIKADTGYHRSGIDADDFQEFEKIVNLISSPLKFKGFLTHAGNTYFARSKSEILKIHKDSLTKMRNLKNYFSFFEPLVSIGDTPACSLADDFDNVDEIRPGNFVYYDLMQYYLGVCELNEIAVQVACPVVSKTPSRNEIVIYGGAVHLSKEFVIDKSGNKNFGLLSFGLDHSRFDAKVYVSSISQEHGIIRTSPEIFRKINIGEIIKIYPVHSCLSANLMRQNKIII